MNRPTPADLAKRLGRRPTEVAAEDLPVRFRRQMPEVAALTRSLGMDADREIRDWIDVTSIEEVREWMSPDLGGFRFAALWRELGASGRVPALFEALVVERHVCSRLAQLGPYARQSGQGMASIVVTARYRVAEAAFAHSFRMGWQSQHVYLRTLELARVYLQFGIDQSRDERVTRAQRGRMGMVSVLAGRRSNISLETVERAVHELDLATGAGWVQGQIYLLEGLILMSDLTGDLAPLIRAQELARVGDSAESIDVSLRIAGHPDVDAAQARVALERAGAMLQRMDVTNPMSRIRRDMSYALWEHITDYLAKGRRFDSRGMTFPFVLRGVRRFADRSFMSLIPRLVRALDPQAKAGIFIYRDVAADLCSYFARGQSSQARVEWLQKAVSYRDGAVRQRPLRDRVLHQALDRLAIARAANALALRREAIQTLAEVRSNDEAVALTYIASDIAEAGPVPGALLPVGSALAIAIRNGDSRTILEMAARRIIANANTSRSNIGGRGTAQVIEDGQGPITAAFVYKEVSSLSDQRDRTRTHALNSALLSSGLSNDYGVIEHVASIAGSPVASDSAGSVISVRRFLEAATLHQALVESDSDRRAMLLTRTARFLAFIHSTPIAGQGAPSGVRRALWESELGRWLRALGSPDLRQEVFSRWWDLASTLKALPRRDAHALNWLVTENERILAVDLDSIGWRPVGYELAQLTDDHVYLAPDSRARKQILNAYLASLNNYDSEITAEHVALGYSLGLLARAVRSLSDPQRTAEVAEHAMAVLDFLANDRDSPAAEIATVVGSRWRNLAGLVGAGPMGHGGLSEGTRRRISRAMAFHLRHDEDALVTRQGWMHVDELVEALSSEGHKVSRDVVMGIAGAMGEARFDLDGLEIRARYGHSRPVSIEYSQGVPPRTLFHATPVANLRSIVEARDGLRPGRRQWVHLATDNAVAVRAATRQHSAVILFEIDTSRVDGLVQAEASTWLAPLVPVEALCVAPLI